MGREELTLSVTGGHLWERVHQAIVDELATLHSGPHRFQLGGGTVLAARWQHRDSCDVAIWTEGEGAIIECRTRSGGVHRIAIAPGEIDRGLDESGIGHHLRAASFGAHRIREALHDACRTGAGRQKVWETGVVLPAAADRQRGRTHEPDR